MSDIAVIETGVRLRTRRAIAVRTPTFSPAFNDRLKAAIPQDEREFRFGTKSWVVVAKRQYTVEKIVLQFFGQFMHVGGKRDGDVVNRDGTVEKQETLAL